jgi:uncharacterized protein (TIGR02453 family)
MPDNDAFPGFPDDLFLYLHDLAENNHRDWFNSNKERYGASVVDPVCDFIEAMRPRLQQISTHFVVDSRPHGGSMFRIYRDARYVKDKRPYKENVACQFRHEAGRDAHAAGFYVHLANDGIFFGGGVWMPPPPVLGRIRDAIAEQPQRWISITRNKRFSQRFGGVHGESLKRPPRGYAADHPCIEDLKRKTFFARQAGSRELAMSPEFINEVTRAFKAASPFMAFLSDALELPF